MAVVFMPPKAPAVRGFRLKETANVTRVTFEGQYSQRARTGPNPIARSGSLTFTKLTAAQKAEILDFLRAREGVEAFQYQVPGDTVARIWTSAEWGIAPEKSKTRWRVTVSLTEEFDLS